MIAVVDYAAGNLGSVGNALDHLGLRWSLCDSPATLARCDRIILPGVGHFASAMHSLQERGLADALVSAVAGGRPFLGLCLGAQLLLESSEEAPDVRGLGILAGRVTKLTARTVPHMGWNRVTASTGTALFDAARPSHFYFAHSFVCVPADPADVAATAEHEGRSICVALQRGRVFGVQFHPEKSADAGLALLGRFAAC